MKSTGGLLIYQLYLDINYHQLFPSIPFTTVNYSVHIYDSFLSKAQNPVLSIYDKNLKAKIKKLGVFSSKTLYTDKCENLQEILLLLNDLNTQKLFFNNLT